MQRNLNLVVTSGQYGGDMAFLGAGAGGDPTAVAVVSDLKFVAGAISSGARLANTSRQSASTTPLSAKPTITMEMTQ